MVAFVRRTQAGALVFWLSGCAPFGTTAQGGPGTSDAGDASAASPPSLVGSQPLSSDTQTVSVALPAGVAVGDVLVAVGCAAGSGSNDLQIPEGWADLGRAEAHADTKSSTAPSGLWAGYHPLGAGESDLTTYTFGAKYYGSRASIFVAGFRGARASQPVAPALVQPTAGTAGPTETFDVPRLAAVARSAALFAVCSFDEQTFPELDGFDRLQASPGFSVYAPKSPLPDGEPVVGPSVELSGIASDAAPVVATASLAIVR